MQQQRIAVNSVVSWSAETVATDVNDEVVLMSMERNRCYGLGTTGSEIWRKLGNPIRVSDVITQLKDQYDAPYSEIEEDVLRILSELREEGLVELHPNHGR
ncbi:MAG TPA: PqqD family peptide modification chaperone [Acidobacteriaceae bacterium]|nr:PqqD family peptide modification chaperone [Acidobacteriaceae bacterium]